MSGGADHDPEDPILAEIGAAEEVAEPLDGLVERIGDDPGAAFTPEVLERLVALRSSDRAAFEALREAQEGRLPGHRARGPCPLLVPSGEQGSAKSSFAAILKALFDPDRAPLRALPREDRDLFIAATNGHLPAFDNLSGLPAWISDTLCRLATGGGFAVRQHYSDQDEVLFDACRPMILNGIEEFVTRPDLADRTILLSLEAIPEDARHP